jgi:hypothetical protein
VIHGLGDLDHLDQTMAGQMRVALDQPQTFRELQEVSLLGSSQRILFEKRNDRLNQITPLSHTVPMHMFLVIVVPPIDVDVANSKELHEHVETLQALLALCHRELMRHLESGFITSSIKSLRLSNEVDRKTTFSIDEAGNPSDFDQSFLLIFRIRRIVTAQLTNTVRCWFAKRVPRNTRFFQHIAEFY